MISIASGQGHKGSYEDKAQSKINMANVIKYLQNFLKFLLSQSTCYCKLHNSIICVTSIVRKRYFPAESKQPCFLRCFKIKSKGDFLAEICTATFSFSKATSQSCGLHSPSHLLCHGAHHTASALSPKSPLTSMFPLLRCWSPGTCCIIPCLENYILQTGFCGVSWSALDSLHPLFLAPVLHPSYPAFLEFLKHNSFLSIEYLHMLHLFTVMIKCLRQLT